MIKQYIPLFTILFLLIIGYEETKITFLYFTCIMMLFVIYSFIYLGIKEESYDERLYKTF